jgi:hypothetical protein
MLVLPFDVVVTSLRNDVSDPPNMYGRQHGRCFVGTKGGIIDISS